MYIAYYRPNSFSLNSIDAVRSPPALSLRSVLRFLPVKGKFSLATVAGCLLMGELLSIAGSKKFNIECGLDLLDM